MERRGFSYAVHKKISAKSRRIYPLDITGLSPAISAAQRKTGIRSQAEIMRLAIERGLPILIAQLDRRAA